MTDYIIDNRLIIFTALMLGMAFIEVIKPARQALFKRLDRWPANLAIGALNSAILYLLMPITVVGVAVMAETHGLGLIPTLKSANIIHANHLMTNIVLIIICIALLDLLIYLQHVLFHRIQWLWPFHAMHHSDQHLDVSSGIRFHPIEIIISLLYKAFFILLLGIPVNAVIIFEILLSSFSLMTHTNVNIPKSLNTFIELIFVTPTMHRIHHSIDRADQNSNYGFCLSIWDRLFASYHETALSKSSDFPLGISKQPEKKFQNFKNMIMQPFKFFKK